MESKEINILNSILNRELDERDLNSLKKYLVNAEGYQKFLDSLVKILIGKEKQITLQDFLELHKLSHNFSSFKNITSELIEEVAELFIKGQISDVTQWLQQSNNQVFLNHVAFLKETKKGISHLERNDLRKKLSDIQKINSLELSENEIRAAIKIVERTHLKKKFNEISKQKNEPVKQSKTFRLKYSTLLVFIIASSIVLAVSVPTIRNFIKKQIKELFTNKPSSETSGIIHKHPSQAPTLTDSLTKGNSKSDSTTNVINKPVNKTILPVTNIKSTKKYKLYSGKGFNGITIKSYENHFKVYKNELDSIEGIWELTGKFVKYNNRIIAQCAIREIENNAFEMVYFDEAGSLWPLRYKYRLVKTENGTKYELQERLNNKTVSTKSLLFQKGKSIRFQITMILSEFNVIAENKNEKVRCNFIGKKRKLTSSK